MLRNVVGDIIYMRIVMFSWVNPVPATVKVNLFMVRDSHNISLTNRRMLQLQCFILQAFVPGKVSKTYSIFFVLNVTQKQVSFTWHFWGFLPSVAMGVISAPCGAWTLSNSFNMQYLQVLFGAKVHPAKKISGTAWSSMEEKIVAFRSGRWLWEPWNLWSFLNCTWNVLQERILNAECLHWIDKNHRKVAARSARLVKAQAFRSNVWCGSSPSPKWQRLQLVNLDRNEATALGKINKSIPFLKITR